MSIGDKAQDAFKLVILDEIDAMTDDAQAILRQVIEKYTSNARFCLICNYIKKINKALQSRCIVFRFSPLNKDQMRQRLNYVIEKENINITEDGIKAILTKSGGDMRKVLNMTQSANMICDKIDESSINTCFGYPQKKQIKIILKALIDDDIKSSTNLLLDIIQDQGLSLSDVINELYIYLTEYVINEKSIISSIQKLSHTNIANILNKMRLVEYNHLISTNDNIHSAALAAVFKIR